MARDQQEKKLHDEDFRKLKAAYDAQFPPFQAKHLTPVLIEDLKEKTEFLAECSAKDERDGYEGVILR